MAGRNGGRPRKPTQVKIAEGNRSKEKLDLSREPQFDKSKPEAPFHLSDYGKEEWDEMCDLIHEAGLLTKPDGRALAGYCESYANWRRACEELNKGGNKLIVKGSDNRAMMNPYLRVVNESLKQMLAFLIQFGLTPASRSKITITKKPSEDPFEEFQKDREGMRGQLREIAGFNKKA